MLADWNDTFRTLAAIVAACAALVGVLKYRSEIESARRLKWQKTTIQAIIQKIEDRISFSDLKEKYRSLAADNMKMLSTKDIADQALRMILIDLCRDQVIVQLGGDTYALTTYYGQIEKNQALNLEMLGLQKVFFEAQLEFLAKNDTHVREMLDELKRTNASLGLAPVMLPSSVIRSFNIKESNN